MGTGAGANMGVVGIKGWAVAGCCIAAPTGLGTKGCGLPLSAPNAKTFFLSDKNETI